MRVRDGYKKIKITTPEDLLVAESCLAKKKKKAKYKKKTKNR